MPVNKLVLVCRINNVPVGVPPEVAPGPRLLSSVHQVDQPRERRVQVGGQQSS